MEMRFEGKESGEMRMRMRMKVEVGDIVGEELYGDRIEMGLRRVVIVSLLAVGSGREEEEEAEKFESLDHFYRDARY